jgi:hypothetical protein
METILSEPKVTRQLDFSEVEAELCHPAGRRGFFSHLVKGATGTRQRSYRIDHLPVVIDRADPALDNYISQAEFIKPNRRVVNLLRMNLSFIDLDIYHVEGSCWHGFEATPQMACAILLFCDDNNIPAPSLIAFSGRGLYLKWLYNEPIPRQALPRWNALQRRLVELFQPFGADYRAKDASRLLRLMGTTNTKIGEVVRVLHVETENGEPIHYGFDWLAFEILETDRGTIQEARREEKNTVKRAKLTLIDGGNPGGLRKFNPMRLSWDRLEDIRKLADLRGWTRSGVPEGHREVYLFWCTNFMLLSGATHPGDMFHEVTALAREVCPALVPEVRQCLSTLYRKAQAHAAGERVEFNGKRFSPLYTPKNQTLIDYLNIRPDEERQLGTIISEAEAADRHRKRERQRDETKRREAGAVERSSYLENAEMKRAHALLLRAKGMTQREIAAEMGISIGAVNAHLKSAT